MENRTFQNGKSHVEYVGGLHTVIEVSFDYGVDFASLLKFHQRIIKVLNEILFEGIFIWLTVGES